MALANNLEHRLLMDALRTRLLTLIWLIFAAMLLLLSRLYTLQVLRGDELDTKGRRNFVQQVRVPHDRGIIYDRHGHILVDNRPSLDVIVTPAFLGKRLVARQTLIHLASLLGMSEDELGKIQDLLDTKSGLERFRPLVVRRDLDPEQIEAIEAQRSLFMLDGVEIVEGRRRTYHHGELAAHLLGYVNEIDAGALEAERGRGNPEHYDLGDMVGREGIERSYEKALRGVDGIWQVVVDAKGRKQPMSYFDSLLGAKNHQDPVPGHNIFLSIDVTLQKQAEAALAKDGQAGSVVALDPKTGAILALVSLPGYNPNLVSGALARQEKERLDANPLKPWLNRSIQGQYAPGSTFKLVTALAGLTEKAVSAHETIHCPGHFKIGRHVWRCWHESGHGNIALYDAMRVSCDTYFYTLGNRLGLDAIARMARLLSFGSRTGIALRGEMPGNVPDAAFHNRVDAATGGYQRGMAVNTAIGQGSLLVTPLQLALAYAAVANGRVALVPQLVDHIETADFRLIRRFIADSPNALLGEGQLSHDLPVQTEIMGQGPSMVQAFAPQVIHSLAIDEAIMSQVRHSLAAVTGQPGGTGFRTRSRKVSTAGKTGTAQVVRLGKDRLKGWEVDYADRDHAWFVVYAPVEDPQIVVAVLNEHGGHGGSAAGPIAVSVVDAFFEQQAATLPIALPEEPIKEDIEAL